MGGNDNMETDLIKMHNMSVNLSGIPKYDCHKCYVCFGAGTATEMFLEVVPEEYSFFYVVDNDENKWGKKLRGYEIISPDKLKEIKNACILLLNRHVRNIKVQLEKMGYKECVDYYDIYTPNESFFKTQKMIEGAKCFEAFIDSLPPKKDWKNVNSDEIIGITVCSGIGLQAQFQLEIYLLLKVNGYNAKLIIDTVGTFIDYRYFKGITIFFKDYIQYLLNVIEDKLNINDWQFVEEKTEYQLTNDDLRNIKQNNHDTLISYSAYIDSTCSGQKPDIDVVKKVIEKENELHYKSLSLFFENNKYNSVLVFNGTCDKSWNYTFVGHKFGIRVPSYDGFLWATDYPCCWLEDNLKLVNILSDEEIKEQTQLGYKLFKDRIINNPGDGGWSQLVEYDSINTSEKNSFDILIPLNVMFDSSVFGLNQVFDTPEEWIYETIKFLHDKTNAKVVIKESPVNPKLATLCFNSYKKYIEEFIDNERIIYYDMYSEINIYNLIENCKFMIPFSSTITLEAAMLNKTSVVHTKCFYSKEKFVYAVRTRKEYFDTIIRLLKTDNIDIMDVDKAALLFSFLRSDRTQNYSLFSEKKVDWIKYKYDDLMQLKELDAMIGVIAENKPWYIK